MIMRKKLRSQFILHVLHCMKKSDILIHKKCLEKKDDILFVESSNEI